MNNVSNDIMECSDDQLLKRKEVMDILRLKSVNTFYKILREGKLKGMQISGGIQVFWKSDILKYLEDLKQNAA